MHALLLLTLLLGCGAEGEDRGVLAAAHDVPPGTVLSAKDVIRVAVGPMTLSDGGQSDQVSLAFTHPSQVRGLVAVHGLRRFELILQDRLMHADGTPLVADAGWERPDDHATIHRLVGRTEPDPRRADSP